MCHHYVGAKKHPELYAGAFDIHSTLFEFTLPNYWPLSKVPIIRPNDNGEREMVPAEWGLLPFWWKPTDKAPKRSGFQRKCFNAKSEEVDKKPSYREAFKRRRCLMPAEEFFEKGHYFHLPDFTPFAFAGLWERWRHGEETVESCTLLTTEPNELVKSVGHHRMPVLLTNEEQYAQWLNPDIVERKVLEPLFLPTDPATMEFYKAPEK